uniref:Uncharacterized protein n=1 Tax=Xiphophorus couchianus TaxID=32473 RepID=A0A3B5L1U0_9TELE
MSSAPLSDHSSISPALKSRFDLDVRRRIPIKLLSKPPLRSKPLPRIQRPGIRPCKPEPGEDEERFDCCTKAGDVFGSQRRFPQPLFWDYKLNLIGERDGVPIHFCDKCGLPIQLYGRMVCNIKMRMGSESHFSSVVLLKSQIHTSLIYTK